MKVRLACSGPSGTGKTTLCEFISKEFDIPFITTSTKPLWDKYGITTHQELINKTTTDPAWGIEFQAEVLAYRVAKLEGVEEFVTDRSPVDNMVYFLMQNSHLATEEDTKLYLEGCKRAMILFNTILALPFTVDTPLENDGKRIANQYYQKTVNSTFVVVSELMANELKQCNGLTIPYWDMEKRKYEVTKLIKHIRNK